MHQRNIEKTVGDTPCEYIRIDNQDNRHSLGAAYNEGVARASGDILVFMHEDVFFMEGDWGGVLQRKFSDSAVGLIGVAGTSYLFADPPGWVVAGRPYIHGHVVHELEDGRRFDLTVFSWEKEDAEVVAVDGLLFAIPKTLFSTIRFDQETFDGFHFYDLDIAMQVRRTHRLLVTRDLLVKHCSGGSFDGTWQKYAARFVEKYHSELPASCVSSVPDLRNRIHFENIDLRGKAPQITIC